MGSHELTSSGAASERWSRIHSFHAVHSLHKRRVAPLVVARMSGARRKERDCVKHDFLRSHRMRITLDDDIDLSVATVLIIAGIGLYLVVPGLGLIVGIAGLSLLAIAMIAR